MLSQALFTGVQRSCRAAVPRMAVSDAVLGREVSSTNTGADCRARAKVTASVVRRLAEGVATRCEAVVPDEWRWHGFRTLSTQNDGDRRHDVLDARHGAEPGRVSPTGQSGRGTGLPLDAGRRADLAGHRPGLGAGDRSRRGPGNR